MSFKIIRPYNADGSEYSDYLRISTEEPLECPFCFSQIETQILTGIFWEGKNLHLFLKCKKCKNSFIGYTGHDARDNSFHIIKLSKGNHKTTNFNEEIKKTFPLFIEIYGESEFAEQNNLMQICGTGYRKALEFLIKDYLVKKYSEKEKEIKSKLLGDCIKELVDNSKIKEIAKRATWLGNDETHYIRKWEDKDLEDLKKLINITVHFISMEVEAEKYMEEMKE